MQLCLYLTPELIISPLKETAKKGIIRELVRHLVKQKKLPNPEAIIKAIEERDATGSTFLPSGIAIPHARVPEVEDIVMAMGVSKVPVQDNSSENGLRARVFCIFLSPIQDKEFGKHLKLLARISALFSDVDFIEEISSMTDAKEIFEALQKHERELDEE